MTGEEYVIPATSQRQELIDVLKEAATAWGVVAEMFGEEVAGDLNACLADAVLLAGYERWTA